MSVMGQIGAEQIGELIIVRQTPKPGRNPAAGFTVLCFMHTNAKKEDFMIHQ